jgi:hypothetical protein
MGKFKKTAVVILVISMLAGLLSGCTDTAGGKALYDAFIKSQTIKSSQSDMNFTMEIDATGLNAEDQQKYDQIKAMLDGAAFSVNMKQEASEDNKAAKAEMNMDMFFGGVSMNMGAWVDMDIAGSDPKFIEIVKLPVMLAAAEPAMAGKEYLVMDMGEMMGSSEAGNTDYAEMTDAFKGLQDKAEAFLKSYLAQYNPGFKFLTDAGIKNIETPAGDVKAHVYRITLDDKQAKKLLRYTVENLAENEAATDLAAEYIKVIQKLAESSTVPEASAEELEKTMQEFETEKPELLKTFNSFMDSIDNIQLIGNEGLVFEYAVDDNGYVVSQSGRMNFLADTAKLAELGDEPSTVSGVYNLTINYDMLTYDINQEIKIDIPQVTPENSLDYMEMMKAQIENTDPAIPVPALPTAAKILVDGKEVSFDAYTIDGNNYFKLRDIAKVIKGSEKQFDVVWEEANKTINLISGKAYTEIGGEMAPGDGKEKTSVPNTSIILKDGVQVYLEAYTIDGSNYFKLRDIAQSFNIGVTWNQESKTIVIDTSNSYVAE